MRNFAVGRIGPAPRVGEEAARNARFNALVACEARKLYSYAYWLCGDGPTAEDLVQDTLLRAWRSLDQLSDPAAARGWLVKILRRENARRFERKRLEISDVPLENVAGGHSGHDTSTEAFVLRRALRALPADYREPLLLQVLFGYSQQEIADQLGLSAVGVGTRLFRARQKLRDIMGEAEDDALQRLSRRA